TPVATSADKTALANGLSAAQGNLSNSLDKVLQVRSSVGTRMNEVDTLNTAGDDLSLQYKQQISDLQGIDYAKAISDLTQQQTYLQATQQAFLKVQGLSLFDYLK
ncbi:MAG: flagellin, partial [Nitrosospira sp.]